MKPADLSALTVAELKALAKKRKIVLPAGAKKADIVKALAKTAVTAAAGRHKAAAGKKAGVAKAAAAKAPKKAAEKKPAAKKPAVKKAAPAVPAPPVPVKRPSGAVVPKTAARPGRAAAVTGEWMLPPGGEQERIAGAKYFTGPEGRGEVTPSLPAGSGDERMVIISRDPSVLFGYWEISQERIDREQAILGKGSKLCVRIYDVTGVSFDGSNATATFDQEVYERMGSWYFDLARPSRRFCADIGLLSPDGRYRTLTRSNTVTMPRETISEAVDEHWMVSDEAFLKLHGLGRGIGGVSSAQIQEVLRAARMHEISSHGLFSPQGRAQKRK